VISLEHIVAAKELINQIYLDEKIEKYILDMVLPPVSLKITDCLNLKIISVSGFSESINQSCDCFKSVCILKRKSICNSEDVKSLAKDVLRHRIGLTFEAEAEEISSEEIINRILAKIQAP
jgi:MoxR-like ATPase